MTISAATSPPRAEIRFAGMVFHPMTVAEAVAGLAARDPRAAFTAYVTPNAEHPYLRRRDPEFVACCDSAFISTNDSRILHRAGRLAGLELDFAPGAYVVRALFEKIIAAGEPITIVGCTPALVAALTERYGLTAVAHHNPPMGFIADDAAVRTAIDFVVVHPARFVFVAMGPPQSEKFCQRVIADGRATGLGLCIGSSLSVLVLDTNPAPDFMERSGLVWLYRLVKEPRRLWRRYLVHGIYGLGVGLTDILALRLGLRRAANV